MKTRREKNRSTAAAALGKPQRCPRRMGRWRGWREPDWLSLHASAPFKFMGLQNGQPTPAQSSATNFGMISAVQCDRVTRCRNAAVCLPAAKVSQLVQWSQSAQHPGQEDRARARPNAHLGNLASALSAHGGAGGKSIIIFFQLRK